MKKEKYILYALNWSMPYINKYKLPLLFLLLLMFVSTALSLIQVNFVQSSIDAVLVKDGARLVRILVLFLFLTGARMLHEYLYGHYSNKVFLNMTRDLKNKFLENILKAKIADISKNTSGDLNTKNNTDIPKALGFIKEIYSKLFFKIITAVGGFIYLFYYNWKLSLFVFISIPIQTVLLNRLSSRSSLLHKRIQEINSDYADEVYDVINGAETIKAYSMQDCELKKIREILLRLFQEEDRYAINDAITVALILSVTYLPDMIALIYGAVLISRGEIAVSLLFAYNQLISTICSPTVNLFSSLRSIKISYQSMKRLENIMEIDFERENGSEYGWDNGIAVQFENVRFGYMPDKPVLSDFSLRLSRGESIGIAGSSGAGKTTIIRLLCGLYEANEGHVYICGHDINDWNLEKLRSKIAYVSQEAYIFPGTVYENVMMGRLDASREEVEGALMRAGLKGFIDSLPGGYDTVLSEDGANMSGGQRQRLSIARALLNKAMIYIFDEPTASLDPETESYVVKTIEEITRQGDACSIIISHNIAAFKNCGEIYHIRKERVHERVY